MKRQKPRILFVCNSMDRSELAIAIGIRELGYDIKVAIDQNCEPIEKIKASGLPIESFSVRHRMDLKAVKLLRSRLEADTPDVIYAPTNRTLSVSLIAAKKLPIKVVGYRGTIGHIKRLNPASWLTYLNPRLAHIICVSEAVRQHLINDVHISANKVTTIHKGHDVAWYQQPDPIDLKSLGVPADTLVIGFAGNMRPVKGVDILIKALDHLPETSKVHLLLIGDVRDNAVEKLTAMPQYKNRLTMTGYRSDAPSLINACDIFVMPSIEREGLPRAVIEAMTMKLPVIVSDVGGMPEQVVNNECGLVVPPSNPKALATAIQTLADSEELCQKFGEAASIRIEKQFNINQTINSMAALFDRQ